MKTKINQFLLISDIDNLWVFLYRVKTLLKTFFSFHLFHTHIFYFLKTKHYVSGREGVNLTKWIKIHHK